MAAPNPSALAMVPFVSVQDMMRIVNAIGPRQMLREICAYIEADFLRWETFDKTPRIPAHSEEGVIELMPTTDGEHYGFKYVNGHPANMARGFQTVTAFGVLAKVSNGYPVLFTEMTILTALRTAATSATRSAMMGHALKNGFVPMVQDGINKVLAGDIDMKELVSTVDLTDRL